MFFFVGAANCTQLSRACQGGALASNSHYRQLHHLKPLKLIFGWWHLRLPTRRAVPAAEEHPGQASLPPHPRPPAPGPHSPQLPAPQVPWERSGGGIQFPHCFGRCFLMGKVKRVFVSLVNRFLRVG